jgi:histidine triad (HIT) family protein
VPEVAEYWQLATKIALAQRKAFDTEMVLSKVFGDEVPHAHIWIFPNREVTGNASDLEKNAEKIRSALR